MRASSRDRETRRQGDRETRSPQIRNQKSEIRNSGDKLAALRRWVNQFDSALVAYSGGVDSALVMAVAREQLGDRALACIGVSPSYPAREMRQAIKLAEQLAAPYRLVHTSELTDAHYAANPTNRCYYCKDELFGTLAELARQEGWSVVLDGANADDVSDYRPGRVAAGEQGVRSPLIEVGMGKEDVRAAARALGLPVWDKPAMACLSSRVPHGTPITAELLRQIEAAEDALAEMGFAQFRVRHHGDIARIELPPDDFDRALARRKDLVAAITAAGYRFVCLDLAGFRSGSLSQTTVELRVAAGEPSKDEA
ncbi:MAG: ATP-dependent sacrificial sulfur transferase LarE [Phycisphaeraceae bacterium]